MLELRILGLAAKKHTCRVQYDLELACAHRHGHFIYYRYILTTCVLYHLTVPYHIVHSSVNVLIYIAFSNQNRSVVIQSLCCLCRQSKATPVELNAPVENIRIRSREKHL